MPEISKIMQEPVFFIIAMFGCMSFLVAVFSLFMLKSARKSCRHSIAANKNLESELQEVGVQLEVARTKIAGFEDNALSYSNNLKDLEQKFQEAEIAKVRAEEKYQSLNERMKDWEEQRTQFTQAAKSSVIKAGHELSSKLLADHKREAEAVKKQQSEEVKQTTEKLMQQFKEITNSVASIGQTSKDNKEQMDMVMRALTNPTGAGKMAEVGLENLLKNFGLVAGQDFIMQYHIGNHDNSGNSLRPDAVVFLPQDMLIVIDSKASKFLIELEENANQENEELILSGLKKTMNQHLKTLAGKDYKAAVARDLKNGGYLGHGSNSFNIMYIPSDAAIERVLKADPEFKAKLAASGVNMVGPSGLFAVFQLAKEQIAAAQRNENNEHIIETLSNLMESIVIALGHIDKVGSSIKSSMEHFDKFTKSTNRNMLPKLERLKKLGVEPAKNKSLPAPLASYDIRRIDQTVTLQAEEVTENAMQIESLHKESA